MCILVIAGGLWKTSDSSVSVGVISGSCIFGYILHQVISKNTIHVYVCVHVYVI